MSPDSSADAAPLSAVAGCTNCGADHAAVGACPYCGHVTPVFEKAADGVRDVRVTTTGQQSMVRVLKAQHERTKGYAGMGCGFVVVVGCVGPFVGWWLRSLVLGLGLLVLGFVGGVALAIREERRLCERELVPMLRQRAGEEGVERSELLRLAGETLPSDSALLQALTALL